MPQIIEVIRKKYTSDPNFTPEVAKKASSAAEGMCKWVHAMDKYENVAKVVAPKQEKLKEAEAQYDEVMIGLRKLQADLQVLMDKLAAMEADLVSNTGDHTSSPVSYAVCYSWLMHDSVLSSTSPEQSPGSDQLAGHVRCDVRQPDCQGQVASQEGTSVVQRKRTI